MNDAKKGKIYGIIFLILILFLIIGGYFLTKYLTTDEEKIPEEKEEEVIPSLKINENGDYIYYGNAEVISEQFNITYQDVIINIQDDTLQNMALSLNAEMQTMKDSLKLIDEEELDAETLEKVIYKEDNIYEAKYRVMTRYFSDTYASLVMDDYEFDCFNGSKYLGSKTLVFNTKTKEILDNEKLMNLYNHNLDSLKLAVQEKLNSEIALQEEVDVTSTITSLDDSHNYALYINKSGQLVISYIVKTEKIDYNDVIILN